ncbi:MAG: hypothetical protein AB8C95_06145 [Phycisphaeraceae bacterium]
MTSNASDSNKTSDQATTQATEQTGYRVWHFALAVPAIAVTLQLMLGSLTPLPKEHNIYATSFAAIEYQCDEFEGFYPEYRHNRLPEVEILPLHLRGDMTGPVLASVIEEYFPESTEQHAADLRDTMPPCDNPRMIVILPKDEDDKPVF